LRLLFGLLELLVWTDAQQMLVPRSSLPLHTSGRFIVNRWGERVRLASVSLYGAHMPQMVMNGLDRQTAPQIARQIAKMGFNSVRLPFSLDLVFKGQKGHPEPAAIRGDPYMEGLTPLEVFDKTVESLTQAGLLVILNNHVSTAKWCCDINDGEGLWFTEVQV